MSEKPLHPPGTTERPDEAQPEESAAEAERRKRLELAYQRGVAAASARAERLRHTVRGKRGRGR